MIVGMVGRRRRITERSIVLLGDSITAGGRWTTLLRSRIVVNEGHPGFTTEDLLVPASRVAAAGPRAVFVLTGTNDIRDGHGADWTVTALTTILERLATAAPDTDVVVQSILPRSSDGHMVVETNQAIESLTRDRRLDHLDLYPHFDRGDGRLRDAETTDGIHLSRAGYRRWAGLLRPVVEGFAAR